MSSFERIQLYCLRNDWVVRILEMLAEHTTFTDNKLVLVEFCELIETIASVSLSPSELKEIIQFLYKQDTEVRFALPNIIDS